MLWVPRPIAGLRADFDPKGFDYDIHGLSGSIWVHNLGMDIEGLQTDIVVLIVITVISLLAAWGTLMVGGVGGVCAGCMKRCWVPLLSRMTGEAPGGATGRTTSSFRRLAAEANEGERKQQVGEGRADGGEGGTRLSFEGLSCMLGQRYVEALSLLVQSIPVERRVVLCRDQRSVICL